MANPTTNYGFVLPTSTDLVTDLPADFDVALQGVDTRLKALQPGTTLGDLAYSSATANTNTRLGIGSSGQVLAVSAGVPAWTTISSGGMTVIQSGTLSSNQVVISSIPQTYKHLRLVMWATTMSATDGWAIRYNSVTTNYVRSSYGQNGATSVNGSVIADTGFYYGNGAADPQASSTFNHWVLDIYDYTNTTGAIAARGNGTYFNTSSQYSTYQAAYSNQATAAAITSLTLKTDTGKTITGNYILWGVN